MKINGFNSQGEVDGNLSFKLYWPKPKVVVSSVWVYSSTEPNKPPVKSNACTLEAYLIVKLQKMETRRDGTDPAGQ